MDVLTDFAVVHICAAHAVEASGQALTRECDDNGLVQFVMFCFGLLLNCAIFDDAKAIFHHMGMVFDLEMTGPCLDNLKELTRLIQAIPKEFDLEGHISSDKEDILVVGKKGINSRFPFTSAFRAVQAGS